MPADSEAEISLRPLADRLRQEVPTLKISVSNSYAIRGKTPKGDYEVRVFLHGGEIRTTFLRRGSNPLKKLKLLCRSAVSELDGHLLAIRANEEKLPWVKRELDPETGDQYVTVLPFGSAPKAARVVVRTSSRTGIVSMNVEDAHEMSPAEAKLIAKALSQACKIAATDSAHS